jgi:hypothetical protein
VTFREGDKLEIMGEKSKYYVPFLFVTDGDLGIGHTFVERQSAIETENDVTQLTKELNASEKLSATAVTLLDWKRIQ